MAVQYIGDGRTDGTSLGYDSSDLISVYGETPVAQRSGASGAAVATSTITTASTTTTPAGYATTTQADAIAAQVVLIRTLVNELRTTVVNFGLHAGA